MLGSACLGFARAACRLGQLPSIRSGLESPCMSSCDSCLSAMLWCSSEMRAWSKPGHRGATFAGHFAMAEGAYRTGWQVTHSIVELWQQPVQPLLCRQKWVVVVPESPAAAKGWKGRTEEWPQQLGHRATQSWWWPAVGPEAGVQSLPSYTLTVQQSQQGLRDPGCWVCF